MLFSSDIFLFWIMNCKIWCNINLVLTVSHNVDMGKTGEFDLLTNSSTLLMKMVVIVLRIVQMKTKEVSIYIFLLSELSLNNCRSWMIAWAEGGYRWAHISLFRTILHYKSTLKATIVQGLIQSRQSLCILTPI